MSILGSTPDDDDDQDVLDIRAYEHEDGDIVMYDADNPHAFLKIDSQQVFDLSDGWMQ